MLRAPCARCLREADLDRCISGPGGGCLMHFCEDHYEPESHECQGVRVEVRRLSWAADRGGGMGLSGAIAGIAGMTNGLRERVNGHSWTLVTFTAVLGLAAWFWFHVAGTAPIRERFVVIEQEAKFNRERLEEVLREIQGLRGEVRVLSEQMAIERGKQAR